MTKTVLVPVELLDSLTGMAEAQAAHLVRKHGARPAREHIQKIAAEARAILDNETNNEDAFADDVNGWRGKAKDKR